MDNQQDYQPAQQNPTGFEPQKPSQGMAVASLVLGILGLIGGWIPVVQYFTTLCSLLAIIFGAISRKKAMEEKQPTGMATAGLVLGIISLALGVIGIICVIASCGILAAAL